MEDNRYLPPWANGDHEPIIPADSLAETYLDLANFFTDFGFGGDAIRDYTSDPIEGWAQTPPTQFVPRRHTHLEGYRGVEQRGEEGLFPFSTPDQCLLQTAPAASPLLTREEVLSPAPAIYSKTLQDDPPIGWPLQDGPISTRGCAHPGVGKHRLEYNPEFPPLHTPNGHPTQNPEEERKAEAAARRQTKNLERKEKIRTIEKLLKDPGEKGEKRSSCLKVLRRAASRLKIPLEYRPSVSYPEAFFDKKKKAFKEKTGRSEATHIYKCLGQRLLQGVRDRDLILDEVIRTLQREGPSPGISAHVQMIPPPILRLM